MLNPTVPPHEPAGPGERVLVIAPHPDDETLALGGWLHQSARRGADLRLLFLTDGDGFALCAALRYGAWPGPGVMRRLGKERRGEALRAAERLGLNGRQIRFLGYPDRGLASLWLDRWTTPFCSPYTGLTARGQDLLADLETLLREFRPERVYYPDSLDDHPDHWAASCFVRMAMARVPLRPVVERSYLIHRGNWPRPQGRHPEFFHAPPTETTPLSLEWESVRLESEAVGAKREALEAYASQAPLVGAFLDAFVRRNELVAWWPEAPDLSDATRDRFGRANCGGVDFTRLEVKEQRVTARLRGRPLPGVEYRIYWKPLLGPPETRHTRRAHGLQAEIEAGGPVLAAAFCRMGPLLLDRTPWYSVSGGDQVGTGQQPSFTYSPAEGVSRP